MEQVDQEAVKEIIDSGVKVLVDFFAPWCGPCQKMTPLLDELSSERRDIRFVKVNVDENSEFANEFDVSAIPCLISFEDGEEKSRLVGFQSKTNIIDSLDITKVKSEEK